ncbi:MAG: class I SAM-dependent methyltransferase [Chloroflexi bacterium]|nr:class I SAM-dependent methyltransferase [Chloroflexota bacterium]MBP8054297.1 class I SAM-dependent methyltransferase [Chloroflexota bacterium]
MNTPLVIQLHAAAERQLRSGSLWITQEAIRKINRPGESGDWVIIEDRRHSPLAVGLYDPYSWLTVRLFPANTPIFPDKAWLSERLAAAMLQRTSLAQPGTTGYRLVHGENDGLPGIVLDRYHHTLLLKLYTTAWGSHLPDLLTAIRTTIPLPQLVLRLSPHVLTHPELLYPLHDGMTVWGDEVDEPILFQENDLWFEADTLHGPRTGFYLDQRDNRALMGTLTQNKEVLIGYAHTGSFSLYAANGGARQITGLAPSQPTLATALRQFGHNQHNRRIAAADHELLVGDVAMTLNQLYESQRRFDVVILNPPPLAHHPDAVENALALYAKLTRRGLRLLRPHGTFFITSRSRALSSDIFYETIHKAARRIWQPLQEIQRTGHPTDHPIAFPEATYLKGLLAQN